MRFYNQPLRGRFARQDNVPVHPRRGRHHRLAQRSALRAGCFSGSDCTLPRRPGGRLRVPVLLVLAGGPVPGREHRLRALPRPVHESHPRRQGRRGPLQRCNAARNQERGPRSACARKKATTASGRHAPGAESGHARRRRLSAAAPCQGCMPSRRWPASCGRPPGRSAAGPRARPRPFRVLRGNHSRAGSA
jgi:hypothetical protein